MSAPVVRKSVLDADGPSILELIPPVNPWFTALGISAALLLVGGAITAAVGIGQANEYGNAVLGTVPGFDAGIGIAVVGGAAVLLGVVIGACWLVLGATWWRHRH